MDDEDETEHSQLLVTTATGWRTEMAKWIGDAHAAEVAEIAGNGDGDGKELPSVPMSSVQWMKWSKTKLSILFGGVVRQPQR
jgi:hypothetical protein